MGAIGLAASERIGATWPIFNTAGQIISLHPNNRSFVVERRPEQSVFRG